MPPSRRQSASASSPVADWQIGPLGRGHFRGAFSCGKPPLDDFLRRLASQYEKRNLGRTYVAVQPGETRVCGYYTLASGAVSFDHRPEASARKLPRHPVPVALLARLAVDQAVQGRGLGEALLVDALRRCLELADGLGIHAVEVHAIDEQARTFYEKYGFVPLLDHRLHLFLPVATIRDGLGPAL
jgi:GNAT superfamily N-acetyltransferase